MQTTNLKILIVDDHQDNLQSMLNCLFEGGYFNILCSTCGEDAITIALKELPDLILMDWDLPGIDGVEAIKCIRKNKSTRNTPMIIATGAMMKSADLKYALESGAMDYIRKPFDKIELLARVQSAIDFSGHLKTIEQQNCLINKQREEASCNEKRLKALIDAAMEAIVFVKDDQITDVSSRFISFTGYEYKELIGRSLVSLVMPEERDLLVQLENAEREIAHISLPTSDKNHLPCEMRMYPFRINGDTVQVLSVRLIDEIKTAKNGHLSKMLVKLKAENQALKQDLERLKRELEHSTLIQYQSNELLNQLLLKLKCLKKLPQQNDKTCQDQINDIMHEIAMVTNDNIWKELKNRICDVHPDYFVTLLRQYPSLTECDLRLLAFIKLNLSTKEIAHVTCQQVNTIKAARRRLRHKLNLQCADISLLAFLAKF
ncbi:response regulator [Ancylomarina sp. YFZ004]